MTQDANKKLISLAKSKKGVDKARDFFLGEIEKDYNPLLWKCYSAHVLGKKSPDSGLKVRKIALLGSSNIIPLKDMLRVMFHSRWGINTIYYTGEYSHYLQELIPGITNLYEENPDIAVVILSIQDILPRIYERPYNYSEEKAGEMLSNLTEDIKSALNKYLSNLPKSRLFVALMPSFEQPNSYVYSPHFNYKAEAHFLKLYEALSELEQMRDNLFLLNTGKLIQKFATKEIEDKRYWYLGRIRYTDLFFTEIAKEIADVYITAISPSKKCLVLDLDNTLWGGIIGQDGLENLVLGQDGLGNAYQDFQREILKLHDKGITLAICSKNNEADVKEVFDKHTGMILKDEHFTAKRINWDDKAKNITEIAKEINIGLDSIVFFDDDPVQRKWVRESLPQVEVPELPQDPFLYPEFLKDSKWFNSYKTSKEDLTRNVSYKAIAKGRKLKSASKNIHDYLKSLDQQVVMEKVNASTISRAEQLSQKTNQFNLTNRRYQMSDIKTMMKNKDAHVYTISVQDCFCDYGITGLLIFQEKETSVFIDEFLLSCRIIGRNIEFRVLDWLKETYKKRKLNYIQGEYWRTKKNAVCEKVYVKNNFIHKRAGKNKNQYHYFLKKVTFSPYKKLITLKAPRS